MCLLSSGTVLVLSRNCTQKCVKIFVSSMKYSEVSGQLHLCHPQKLACVALKLLQYFDVKIKMLAEILSL